MSCDRVRQVRLERQLRTKTDENENLQRQLNRLQSDLAELKGKGKGKGKSKDETKGETKGGKSKTESKGKG